MSDFSQQHLLAEIESLKAQLNQKDAEIADLEARLNQSSPNHNSTYKIKNAVKSAINSLQERLVPSNISELSQLQRISEDPNLDTQISSLFTLQQKMLDSIPRLCSQLRGHVDFLTRLSSTPDLQSLFLISDQTGNTFLQETTRKLLLEQAARTSKLISSYPSEETVFGTFDSKFNINRNQSNQFSKRIENIQKLLEEDIEDPDELRSLLLQEVMVSSSLNNIAYNANEALRQIYSTLTDDSSNDNLENFNYDKIIKLVDRLAKSSNSNNISSHRNTSGIENSSILSNKSKNSKLFNQQNRILSDSEWRDWASRLYYGLTQLSPESQSDIELRISIEEASLTSIGTQILQNRLKSLRIQKSVMEQPSHYNKSNKNDEFGFTLPLICVLSCLRMKSRARSSNLYSTKRKVSNWSKINVI
ncbi:hypothetical protein TRFO_27267 [Tritrichomonas foetus]|uniref:Uncharacterized protein n=1 Tax=Tritrichomonas foetus TaxID=1144522 RepID=A0A1J4K177_9EUKA|nr:hypothetical protein TRFO_27267 [Tritrichomonas foetus]|eukprot:OHT05135.1 hypothetical protein TRFO_27267 [Tritrichomonas foetus]